jgi:hypothetical protein
MEILMVANQPAATCLPAFLPAGKLCTATPPNKQTAVALGPPEDSSSVDKETVPEGEFAVLLAALQEQAAVTAGGVSGLVTAELPAPAGLRMAEQPAFFPGPGAGVVLMQEKPPAGTGAVCLTSLYMQRVAGPPASPLQQAVLKPEMLVPAVPLNGQTGAEKALAMMLPDTATAEAAELQGLINSFEQLQPPPQGEETGTGPAKTAFAGTELPLAVRVERSLNGGPDQEQSEGKPAESSSQAVFKAAGPVPEPVQAEMVRRLESVKSAVVEQVLEKIVFSRTESGEAKVFIRLKPPALGEVEISLQMDDGRLTGRIVTESLLVRELLEASLGQLRQRLEAQQLHVAELTVSLGQEKGFHHGRDRTEVLTPFSWSREQPREEASPLPTAAPGLLNALA